MHPPAVSSLCLVPLRNWGFWGTQFVKQTGMGQPFFSAGPQVAQSICLPPSPPMRREFIREVVPPCSRAGDEERGRQSVLSEARSGHGCRSREGAMGQQWKQVAGHAWLLVPNEPRTTSPEQPDEHSGSLGCSVPLLLLLTPG